MKRTLRSISSCSSSETESSFTMSFTSLAGLLPPPDVDLDEEEAEGLLQAARETVRHRARMNVIIFFIFFSFHLLND